MSAYRVGLTGGLASGKSAVARRLRDRGYEVHDADRLVAELYRPGAPGAAIVASLFGRELLTANGAVDKPALARVVFADAAGRERLEAAIHPLVRNRFAELARAAHGVVVLEATLLVEAGYAPDFDWIVSVEAPEALRLERAVGRGLAPAAARARLEAQGDGAERRSAADEILENSGDLTELERRADQLADALARRAERARRAR